MEGGRFLEGNHFSQGQEGFFEEGSGSCCGRLGVCGSFEEQ